MVLYSYVINRVKIMEYTLNNGEINSNIVSSILQNRVDSSSSILKRLYKQGWLNRHRNKDVEWKEYVYYPSPKLYSNFEDYKEYAIEIFTRMNKQ